MPSRTTARCAALFGLALFAFCTARAADLQELIKETQRTTNSDGTVQMVWWMAQQFWEESMKANPALTDEARAQVLAPLSDYVVFAVMHAKVGGMGLSDAASKADLQQNLHLRFGGKEVAPVPPEQLAPAAQLMLAQTKPALAATAGQVGQSLEFIVFPHSVDGKNIDATQPGDLAVTFYGQAYNWHLPLGSLLPPKIDKQSGEQFPGNYLYNPYTGKKLDNK